jgi:beta-N-acetylhexosaminidase
MKAVASQYRIPAAAVMALQAGCDGVLICSGDPATQVAALEAVIHAIEEERLPVSRIEEALTRHRRAKERFLTRRAVGSRPEAGKGLRQLIGRAEHQAIADEMARFA